MKKFLGVLVSSASLISTAYAADLLQVYQQAEINDARFLAAYHQRSISTLQPALAKSARDFNVSFSANLDAQRDSISGGGNNNSDSYISERLTVSVSKTLYGKQSALAVDQASLQDQQAELVLLANRQNLILRVANAYFLLLGAQDNLELATSEKIAIKRQLELADERLNVGIGTQTDLFDAKARFQIAEANEIDAGNLIEDARQNLIQIIASDPGDISKLAETAPLDLPMPDSAEIWVANAMENNPSVLAQTLGFSIAQLEVESQLALRSPTLSLTASQSFSHTGGSALTNTSSSRDGSAVGVQLSMPIYLGGAISIRIEQAGLNANVQEQNLIEVKRQITRNVRNVFNDVVSGIKRVNALKQAVVAGESAVEAKNEGFAAGLITNLDVLDAQRDLYQAQRNYLRARYDFILAVLSLEESSGMLDTDDVRHVNSWLE
ncbi:MAG: outer membrane protein [Parasphingorhabdus sp.]|jgi:outer membrane protein